MTRRIILACSALALAAGLSFAPAAQAAETGDGMSKMSGDAMMQKGSMKMHKKHKSGMMKGGAMKGDAIKGDAMKGGAMEGDGAAPQQ